jgi:superfamily I DNA/RNA helicase
MNNVKVIFGPPGCGKTTRLMALLENILKEHAPDKVAFVSFTRKGTYEGAERARTRFGYKEDALPYFRTLHSIAFRAGGYSTGDIIGKRDYREFGEAMGMDFTGYYTEDLRNNDDKYLFLPGLRKNNPRAAANFTDDIDTQKLAEVESNFERFKQEKNIVDFTDIIEVFVREGKALPVEVAIIDEAQDLTTLQWSMCEVAFKNAQEIYIAGDDDQAIYEWSGADVERFLALPREGGEILGKSWRLQRAVFDFSQRISARIENRVTKPFEPVGEGGSICTYNDLSEIEIFRGETWMFLARNNWFLSQYRDLLRRRAQVFMDKGNLSYDPRDVAAIKAWEKRRKGTALTDAESARLKLAVKEGADPNAPWFDALKIDVEVQGYLRDLIRVRTPLTDRSFEINTIHGVKGGEADNVVLLLDFTKAVRANFERNPDAELRCLYVACTRAKKNIHLVHSVTKNGYDNFLRMEAL